MLAFYVSVLTQTSRQANDVPILCCCFDTQSIQARSHTVFHAECIMAVPAEQLEVRPKYDNRTTRTDWCESTHNTSRMEKICFIFYSQCLAYVSVPLVLRAKVYSYFHFRAFISNDINCYQLEDFSCLMSQSLFGIHSINLVVC